MTKAVEQTHTNAHLITVLWLELQKTLELVLRGFNDFEVAKSLHLRRDNIGRWRNNDAAFHALLKSKRAEMLDANAGDGGGGDAGGDAGHPFVQQERCAIGDVVAGEAGGVRAPAGTGAGRAGAGVVRGRTRDDRGGGVG